MTESRLCSMITVYFVRNCGWDSAVPKSCVETTQIWHVAIVSLYYKPYFLGVIARVFSLHKSRFVDNLFTYVVFQCILVLFVFDPFRMIVDQHEENFWLV